MRNKINYIGPNFPTFYTRNSETKPDIVLTNQKFFCNTHIQAAGIGPSDHITVDIRVSTHTIQVPCPPKPDINNTDWEEYKKILTETPLINLDGKNILDIHNAFDNIYKDINQAKQIATPMKTIINKNNLRTTAKFKRLMKILNKYYIAMTTRGKTEHLEKNIRDTQLLLIQEGNIMKFQWWERQIEKIELAAKCNKKFWRKIKIQSGKKRTNNTVLKYKENNTEHVAKTDREKETLFTKIMKDTCKISEEENRQFCQQTEQESKIH